MLATWLRRPENVMRLCWTVFAGVGPKVCGKSEGLSICTLRAWHAEIQSCRNLLHPYKGFKCASPVGQDRKTNGHPPPLSGCSQPLLISLVPYHQARAMSTQDWHTLLDSGGAPQKDPKIREKHITDTSGTHIVATHIQLCIYAHMHNCN